MGSPNIIPAQYDPRSPSYTLLYTTTKLITLYHDQTKFFTSSKMMLGYPSYSAERRQRCTTTTIRSRRAHSRRVLDTAALNAYVPNDVGSKSHCELTWNRVVAVFTFFGLLMTALVSLCCWSHFQFTVERRRLGAQKEYTFTKKPLGLTIVDVDNKVIVTKVKNPACLREGIVPGSRLLSVGDLRWGCQSCNNTGRVPGRLYGTNPCKACNGTGNVTDLGPFTNTFVTQYVETAQSPIKISFKCPLKGAYLEVTGAGTNAVNGWYARKKKAEGPPRAWPKTRNWKAERFNTAPHWYKKDDGCYIYRARHGWYMICADGRSCYYRFERGVDADTPPGQGWIKETNGQIPAPTLRAVP